MTNPKDNQPPARSKVAEQALQVLRETRAKMDPALLSRMKALLSPLAKMPPSAVPEQPRGLENKDGLFAAAPAEKPTRASSPSQAASVYGNIQKQAEASPSKAQDINTGDTEPVDRQKIAKIVLKYMELREEKKPGN